ncbi:hypothetical protein ACJ73_10063 [Blastomyces percursus]|uniref:F-box domain-containing protein n=1 Tax=Blastomyces percursus TaxID=1658174 RepID=A0A1J9P1X9_9EURO|nr:hypothetical protein ACJ73_10063 [Blastomyces percursus]
MTRLTLFSRSVRESQRIGKLVLSLRMPYMTREAGKLLLAQTVLMLPNLQYVDLPVGFYCDDESTLILKQTLIARCPDIRRMKYNRGSEKSFAAIQPQDEMDNGDPFLQSRQLRQPPRPQIKVWPNLEVLELSGLSVSIDVLRNVLVQFPRLTDLKLEELNEIEPVVFKNSPSLTPFPFPPIERLTLNNTPGITDRSFMDYFSSNRNKQALKHLTLSNTGITPGCLHHILNNSPRIHSLSVTQYISEGFIQDNVPQLASRSLRLFHYEITARTENHAAYYYKYLMSSLLSGSLPGLLDLYVRDAKFPEMLMYASLPQLGGASGDGPPKGLNQAMSVYSKGANEAEWNFTAYEPLDIPGAGGGRRRGSSSRPVSFHGAQLSPAWGDEARRSVLVGNGVGGFLALPGEEERPKSSGGAWMHHHHRREGSKGDLWR